MNLQETREEVEDGLKELGAKVEKRQAVVPGTYNRCFRTVMIKCRNFLISIIHCATGMPVDYLEEHLVLAPTEYETERLKEKDGRSDIVVTVENNSIILEMDSSYHSGVLQKNLSYMARNMLHQVEFGEKYSDATEKMVILIQIINGRPSYFPEKGYAFTFHLSEDTYHFHFTESPVIYYFDIAKIPDSVYNRDIKELDEIEKYLMMLKLTDISELSTLSKGNDSMEEVKKTLEDMASPELFTEYEREKLEEYCLAYGRAYERKEGREEGRKEGIEIGKEQGIEIGERNKTIQIAKDLLKQGKLTTEDIAEALNLPIEEVGRLKEEI